MAKNVDRAEISSMIQRIEAFSPLVIDDVVGRIPDTHLVPPERVAIAAGLKERQGLLRAALAATYEG
jgi:hypothetical protein